MEIDKWEEVLIQWINCLKLTDTIADLESLRNGEFFAKLLATLEPENVLITCEDSLTISLELIKSQYPNYVFNREYVTDLKNISLNNIVTICSLLLHFACVVEKKDSLIVPSCNKLPSDVQINIKNFLEKVNSKITNFHFKKIIDEMNESNVSSNAYQWMPIGDSPLIGKSPLQDYLKSPSLRKIKNEKNRELQKLKSALESERFEKADLLEEVKEHKNQIKKFENQIKEKSNQISKLRSELYALESKTPPHSNKVAKLDIEKQLKLEIQNLESYISQLQLKQDELQEENIHISEKFRASSEDLKIWKQTTQGLELNNKELLDKYVKQELELENLKLQCMELSAILEETRNNKEGNDSSIFFSPSRSKRRSMNNMNENAASFEDLAHTIIDVQLKDAQKENVELRSLLKETADKGSALQVELKNTKINYEELGRKFADLESERISLLQEITNLEDSSKELDNLKREIESEVDKISASNIEKDLLISSLNDDLKKSSDLCENYKKVNQNVISNLENLQAEFAKRENLIIEKDILYENLRQEADSLQVKYDDSINNFNKTNFDMESLKTNYERFTKNLEKSLSKLENAVYGYNELKFDDNFLENVVTRLELNKASTNEEINHLKKSLSDYEDLVQALKQEISVLQCNETIAFEERENLKKLLTVTEANAENLRCIIEGQNDEINAKASKIIELNGVVQDLKKMKQLVIDKDLKITNLEEIIVGNQLAIDRKVVEEKILKENVNKFEEEIAVFKQNITDRDEEISESRRENSVLTQENVKIQLNLEELMSTHAQDIVEQEKYYLEKIQVCNIQMQECTEKVEQLEVVLKITCENLDLKSIELVELMKAKQLMEENYAKVTEDIQRKVEITDDTIKKLEIELSIVESEKENLTEDVHQLNTVQQKFLIEKEQLLLDIRELKTQLKESFEKLSNAEDECSQKDTIISENSKELLAIKLDLESKKQEYRKLQDHVEKLNLESSSYKFCIDTLEVKNEDFQDKVEKLEGKLDVLNNLKTCLEKKSSDLEKNMENVMGKLAFKNSEVNEIIEKLNEEKRNSELKMKELQMALEESKKNIEMLEEEKINVIDKNDRAIMCLKQEINRLNDKIYELNAKEVDYIHEIQVIKSELTVAFEKYTQSFDEQQEFKLEHEAQIKNLTENLHEVVTNYNQLERNYQNDINEVETINIQLEKLKGENVALEIKIIEQKKKYDQEIEETNEQFNSDFKQLKSKELNLEQLLIAARSDLELQKGIQLRLENDVKKFLVGIGEVEIEKGELLKKIKSLEETKFKLQHDYKSLELIHEEYVLANETDLKLKENQYKQEINNVEIEKEHLQETIKRLVDTISSLQTEKESFQEIMESDRQKYEQQLKEMQNKIEQLQCTNSRIVEEQNNLQEKILEYQQHNENSRKVTAEQAEIISKLKSAFDILQTGKERVELDLKNIIDFQKKVENEYVAKEIQVNETLVANDEKMKTLCEDLEQYKTLYYDRNHEVINLSKKLTDLQKVNEAMKDETESLEEQLKESTECHEMFLNKIDEENLQAIHEMLSNFVVLKTKYEEISSEIISLRVQRKELKEKIENSSENMVELQEVIESKDAVIGEFKDKINNSNEIIRNKQVIVEELTEELTDTVNNLVLVKNEKLKLDVNLQEAYMEIDRLKKSREEILESQHKIIKETEDNILRAHADAIDVKNDLLMNIENAKEEVNMEKNEKLKIQKLLDNEKAAVSFFEIEILNIKKEKSKYERVYCILKKSLERLHEILDLKICISDDNLDNIEEEKLQSITMELEKSIVDIYRKSRELTDLISKLQDDEGYLKSKLEELEQQRSILTEEKKDLLAAYNSLTEKHELLAEQQTKEKEEMKNEITVWMNKFEENTSKVNDVDTLKTENEVLHQTIISLKDKNVKAYNIYNDFTQSSKTIKTTIDKILKDRNTLENLIYELRRALIYVQTKGLHLNRESKHYEQKESLEFIVDDIQKQFNRYSKITYNLAYNNVQVSEKVVQGILSEKYVEWQPLFKDLNIDEVMEKLEELHDRTSDALDQLRSFEEVLTKNEIRNIKTLKENVPKSGFSGQLSDSKKEEEWRKKYNLLRQKLTLTENLKCNYEKKLKQLRQENKKLSSESNKDLDQDIHYKILLQQHVQTKEEFEKKVSELKGRYQKLQSEYVELKKQKVTLKVDDPVSAIDSKTDREVEAIKAAYSKLMTDNSRLELDNATYKKIIEDKNNELIELSLVREAYEKLLEENSKMMTEVDTLKYKRSRDKEDFMHLLKKEREEREGRENKKIQQVRVEYEGKLESMKAKMLNLYKEEIDKETKRLTIEKHNYDVLKLELDDSKRTIEQLKISQRFDLLGSRESLSALSVKSECDTRDVKNFRGRIASDTRITSGISMKNAAHDRRYATMPRSMTVIKENNRTSINSVPPDLGQNLEMEDEDELFNNKYLTDLKEGHCVIGTSGDRSSRITELAWRNSLCPPHLKSSYPAEMQFTSPARFKEEDLKIGHIDFDDSMSTKLLPGEKSRKKDIGTTSYKKPGPPTPSKNGGRLSLQSNDIQLPKDLQDLDVKTPKRTTPSRLKAFFLALNSSTKNNNSEVGQLDNRRFCLWNFCQSFPEGCTNNVGVCSCSCHARIVCVCPINQDYLLDNCFLKMILENIWCCTKHFFLLLSMVAATVYINRAGFKSTFY